MFRRVTPVSLAYSKDKINDFCTENCSSFHCRLLTMWQRLSEQSERYSRAALSLDTALRVNVFSLDKTDYGRNTASYGTNANYNRSSMLVVESEIKYRICSANKHITLHPPTLCRHKLGHGDSLDTLTSPVVSGCCADAATSLQWCESLVDKPRYFDPDPHSAIAGTALPASLRIPSNFRHFNTLYYEIAAIII